MMTPISKTLAYPIVIPWTQIRPRASFKQIVLAALRDWASVTKECTDPKEMQHEMSLMAKRAGALTAQAFHRDVIAEGTLIARQFTLWIALPDDPDQLYEWRCIIPSKSKGETVQNTSLFPSPHRLSTIP